MNGAGRSGAERSGVRGRWPPLPSSLAAGLAAGLVLAAGCGPAAAPHRPATPGSTTAAPGSGAAGTSGTARPTPGGPQDPARFATPVRTFATMAGVEPRLLMAILYNESYKPHDPTLERAWLRIDPNAALGVADMHRSTFDDVKRGRDFAGRDWTELPDDPDLAIEAAAWYLHDLAGRLPPSWPATYTRDELLALGYNAGPGSMTSFAQGAKPGTVAQGYLDRLHANWDAAATALS